MEKAAASSAHQLLQVLLMMTLLAVCAAEYRPRPGPPHPHMRGPPTHKSYSSPGKHHYNHHFHQNSYSNPSPSFSMGSQFNRPMRFRKPQGSPSHMSRPSWDSSFHKPSNLERYKSPPHYSSGEPPATIGGSSPSASHLSNSGPLSSLGGLESFSSSMDFKHLNPDLSPIRTIPAPNLGPSSWPTTAHVGLGALTSQLAASQSAGVFPTQLHPSLDMSDASTAAALLAASKQHGYQVSEPTPLYAPDPDPNRASLLQAGLNAKLQNDLSLRLSPYTTMPQLMNQAAYPALPSLSSQDLYHLFNGFPLQQDAHTYIRQGQSAVTDAAQLQTQLHQAQLQQAQLQQAQLQQAQIQQAQAQLQQAQLEQGQLGSSPPNLRFSFDEQQEQLLHPLPVPVPGRRGHHPHLPHELQGADSSPVVRLYHNGARRPTEDEDADGDSEVDGSEHTGVSVSPSPTPAHDVHEYHKEELMRDSEESVNPDGDFSDHIADREEQEEIRPPRIRIRKNRDRVASS